MVPIAYFKHVVIYFRFWLESSAGALVVHKRDIQEFMPELQTLLIGSMAQLLTIKTLFFTE